MLSSPSVWCITPKQGTCGRHGIPQYHSGKEKAWEPLASRLGEPLARQLQTCFPSALYPPSQGHLAGLRLPICRFPVPWAFSPLAGAGPPKTPPVALSLWAVPSARNDGRRRPRLGALTRPQTPGHCEGRVGAVREPPLPASVAIGLHPFSASEPVAGFSPYAIGEAEAGGRTRVRPLRPIGSRERRGRRREEPPQAGRFRASSEASVAGRGGDLGEGKVSGPKFRTPDIPLQTCPNPEFGKDWVPQVGGRFCNTFPGPWPELALDGTGPAP